MIANSIREVPVRKKMLYIRRSGLKSNYGFEPIFRLFFRQSSMLMNRTILSRIVIVIAALCSMSTITRTAFSQRLISYQGIITQSSIPLNGSHTLTFSIYPRAVGGTPIYTETQTITFKSDGEFDALIGQVTPLPILPSLDRKIDHYYLGVSVDGSPELSPRSPFSDVPQAFYADTAGFAHKSAIAIIADTAAYARATDLSSIPVTSVNGITHPATLVGKGSTVVTTAGDTITVFSTGIQEIQNADGTVNIQTILNSNGTTAILGINDASITNRVLAAAAVGTTNLMDSSVTNRKLSSGSVTIDKVSSTGTVAGRVLTSNGLGQATWQTVTAQSLQLPYSGTDNSSVSLFSISNLGTGPAISASGATGISSTTSSANGIAVLGTTSDGGAGTISNSGIEGSSLSGHGASGLTATGDGIYGSASTTGVAVHGVTTANATTARAGLFENLGTTTSGNVLESRALGTGDAGYFQINNATSTANGAVEGTTNGLGSAGSFSITNSSSNASTVAATTSGIGNAGSFQITNSTSAAPALLASTSTTASGATAIYGWSSNASGTSTGVLGQSEGVGSSAVIGLSNNTSGSGVGVFGRSRGTTGIGILGQTDGTTGGSIGIRGFTSNTTTSSGTFVGVQGDCNTPSANGYGVFGQILNAGPGRGVFGQTGGSGFGVYGINTSVTAGSGTGVYGQGAFGLQGATTFNGGFGAFGTASGGTGYGVFGTTGSTAGTGTGVYAQMGGTSPTVIGSSNALIANYAGSTASSTTSNNIAIFTFGSTREFRFANNGQAFTVTGGAWNSGGADLAEAFDVVGTKSTYEPGDVLVLSASAVYHLDKCSVPYCNRVAGVYATAPGVVLGFDGVNGDSAMLSAKVPMGVIGVLPTKVCGENGAIAIGDLLVTSSTPGCAMKGDEDKLRFGNILGKAMEPFNGKGTRVIKVLVGKY
jgi:hypothetical protein